MNTFSIATVLKISKEADTPDPHRYNGLPHFFLISSHSVFNEYNETNKYKEERQERGGKNYRTLNDKKRLLTNRNKWKKEEALLNDVPVTVVWNLIECSLLTRFLNNNSHHAAD